MSYDNKVHQPDASTLLKLWLEHDVASMQSQRAELDARIQRAQQLLATLGDPAGLPHRETHFEALSVTESELAQSDTAPHDPPTPHHPTTTLPRRSIISLGLETRTHNAIVNAGITSFTQLVGMTPNELRALPGFGAGCMNDLEEALRRVGVELPHAAAHQSAAPTNGATSAPQHHSATTQTFESAAELSENAFRPDTRELSVSVNEPPQRDSSGYNAAIALAYRFGVIRVEDLASTLSVANGVAEDELKADTNWRALPGGWFVRDSFTQSWIAKRTFEVLNGIKSVAIEPLYQALKRVAAPKFLEYGCRMPTRALLVTLVQELRTEGVRFDIIKEIVSTDGLIHDRELSGTAQAILKAFDTHHRALTGAEVTAKIQSAGLSEASAQVALSTSPLVHRLERGVYGLVGRHADVRDIANARLRREVARMPEGVEA